MSHLQMEVVGWEQHREVTPIKDGERTVDLIPGAIQSWLVIAIQPNGETVRAQVSEADWERVVAPSLRRLAAERAGQPAALR